MVAVLDELRTFLLADADVAALVGGNRVFAGWLPQNETRPTITLIRVSNEGGYTTEGRDRLSHPRIQVDAWSTAYLTACELADAVQSRIDGYRGRMGVLDAKGIFLAGEQDVNEPDPKIWRVTRDYEVWVTDPQSTP